MNTYTAKTQLLWHTIKTSQYRRTFCMKLFSSYVEDLFFLSAIVIQKNFKIM
jgi:hypothetical protein